MTINPLRASTERVTTQAKSANPDPQWVVRTSRSDQALCPGTVKPACLTQSPATTSKANPTTARIALAPARGPFAHEPSHLSRGRQGCESDEAPEVPRPLARHQHEQQEPRREAARRNERDLGLDAPQAREKREHREDHQSKAEPADRVVTTEVAEARVAPVLPPPWRLERGTGR